MPADEKRRLITILMINIEVLLMGLGLAEILPVAVLQPFVVRWTVTVASVVDPDVVSCR